ncbi:MAG: subclass B3 metallo-beta-lactamase [Gemmatimonadetes bacterium]|nr:subclass B3 metallo-beta-lactamase [Gemmatimonadota bacterium]
MTTPFRPALRGASSLLLLATVAIPAAGAQSPLRATAPCASCATWNTPQPPVRIHGNTWYVGTRGLAAILITSAEGHVLIDGGLEESAPLIAASVRAAGFRLEDIKFLLNSHVHYDHAGGLSLLQRATQARVAALPPAAAVLRTGRSQPNDPQHREPLGITPVRRVEVVRDLDTVRVGRLAITAHHTGGHTPGGTTWTWSACDSVTCREIVYADSQSPISSDGFRFSGSEAATLFRAGYARLESLSCDILVTPHPDASRFWQRVDARAAGAADALVDREACRGYATNARTALARRLEAERTP